MTLAQLKAFVETARSGSFAAAAKKIGTAQASVSELVHRLEEEFGTQLFVLVNRRLKITTAGEELLPRAELLVRTAAETIQTMAALRSFEAGTASFGLLKYSAAYSLSDLAKQFHEAHPNLKIRLIGQNSTEVAAAVRSGALEAGLIILPINTDGLEVTPIIRDEIFYATSEASRLPKRATSQTLATSPMIVYDTHLGLDPTRRQLTQRAEATGFPMRIIMELENAESALSLVSRGVGDTYIFEAMLKSPLKPANLLTAPFDPPLYDIIAIVTREGAILSPATKEMAALAGRILQTHGQPL